MQRFKKAIKRLTLKFQKTMKKLVFMFVAMAAVSFASCGGSNKEAAVKDTVATDSVVNDSVENDSVCADSVAGDSVVADSVAA